MSGAGLGNVNLTLGLNTSPATQALQQYYQRLNQGAQKAAKGQKPVESALNKLTQSAKKLGLSYDKASKTFRDKKGNTKSIKEVQQRVSELNKSLAKTAKVADKAFGAMRGGFQQVLTGIPQGIGMSIGNQLLAPIRNLGAAVSDSATKFVDIDRALRQTLSIAGESSERFGELSKAMTDLASATKFTASQLSEASVALARAGFNIDEIKQALPGIAEGAAAAGEDIGAFSDVVVAALGGFQKGTSETSAVVDTLTAAANNSNTSVRELGEGLKYVGPIAKSLGLEFNDVAAAAGLLANAGIKSSQMGTTLRAGLTRLAAAANGTNSEFITLSRGTGNVAIVLQSLGTELKGVDGNLKPLPDLLKTLKSGMDRLGSTEKAQVAKILFGDEAGTGFISLLNQSTEEIDRFVQITNNATGVAAETSAKNLAGIAGSLDLLASAVESAQVSFGEFLGKGLKPIVDGVTAVFNAFNSLDPSLQTAIFSFGALTVALGLAAAAFVAFKAVQNTALFADLGIGAGMALTSLKAMAVTIKTQVIASLATLEIAMLKNVAGIQGGLIPGLVTLQSKLTIAAAGSKALTLALGALSLGLVTAAVLSLWAAFETLNPTLKNTSEFFSESDASMKELNETLVELGETTDETNSAWDRKIERIGRVQAVLDLLRKSLGLTTQEENALAAETVRSAEENRKAATAIDKLTGKYKEMGAELATLDKTSNEYKEKQKELQALEQKIDRMTQKRIRNNNKLIAEMELRRDSGEKLTEAEQTMLNTLEASNKEFEAQRDYLAAVSENMDGTKTSADRLAESLKNLKNAADEANEGLEQAKKDFNGKIKSMEQSYGEFKKEVEKEFDVKIGAVDKQIKEAKKAGDLAKRNADERIRQIKEIDEAEKRYYDDTKREAKQKFDDTIRGIEEEKTATSQRYEDEILQIRNAKRIAKETSEAALLVEQQRHDKTIQFLDRELGKLEQARQLTEDRYDAAIEKLRELTPSEQKLADLEKKRLERAAKGTGEEALRAKAQLERAAAEEKIAQAEKQKAEELSQIDQMIEKDQEQKRAKEEAFVLKMAKLKEKAAAADKAFAKEVIDLQAEKREEEREFQLELAKLKKEEQALTREAEELERNRSRSWKDEIKEVEKLRREQSQGTADFIEKLEAQKEALELARKKRLEAEEVKYQARRRNLLNDFNEAIGESSNYIVASGDKAWTKYADNAVIQLERVRRAAALAAKTASAVGGGRPVRWAGGPVSGGTAYTVNELGQEAFLSKSGELSMINAPAFGTWRAPSSGTVLNAAVTEKLGLNGSSPALAKGAQISGSAAATATQASGNGDIAKIARAISSAVRGDRITNNVTIQSGSPVQAASDMLVEMSKLKRRRYS